MRWSFVLCVLLAGEPAGEAARKDLKAMQGTWTMAALEINGKDEPIDKLGAVLAIKGTDYIVESNKRKTGVTLRLDPSKNPREMDMTFKDGANKERVHKAIYKLEKGMLIICRGLNPEQDRPREFATWPDTGYFVVKWKKQ